MNESITRAEISTALQSLSAAMPQMRFGQLVAAVGELCADLHGRGLWDATDAEFLEAVWQFHRNFEVATVKPATPEAEPIAAPDLGRHVSFASPQGFVGGPGG